MKRPLYFIYIGLLFPLLLACQKDNIAPTGELLDTRPDTLEVLPTSCNSYFYMDENNEPNTWGTARPDRILVGFMNKTSEATQHQILSNYFQYAAIERTGTTESGQYTVVKLKDDLTCLDAEILMQQLRENEKKVLFAGPVFDDPGGWFAWRGVTNEFIVTLENKKEYTQLKKFADETGTEIIKSKLNEPTYTLYITKKTTNVFEMCTLYNQQSFVQIAEPNPVWQMQPFLPDPL